MTRVVGDTLPAFRIAGIDPEGMKVWARALRDPNPIHLDVAAVAAAGLGEKRINQGPANLAYIINMLRAAFPDRRVASLDVRYLDNVLEGDTVVAGGAITGVTPDSVECAIWLDVAGRGRVIAGTTRMVID
jgi:acyl dehydratase